MKCIYCEKHILPWHKYCTHCGGNQRDEVADNRRFTVFRYKQFAREFNFSKKNIAKIAALNNALAKRMKQLFYTELELCEMFVHLQESGHEDFYEFTIRGEINLTDSYKQRTTSYADEETAEKLWEVSSLNYTIPHFVFDLNYDSNFFWLTIGDFLEPVPHTGIFANPAFDKMKICRAMDIIFNKQKCYTLQDALYMTAESFQTEFNIDVAKHLWQPDKKLWNGCYFGIRCPSCKRLVLPFTHYCPKCGGHGFMHHGDTLKGSAIKEKVLRKHNWNRKCRRFSWCYDNKMKIYEITDYTTELFYKMYDEEFFLQKIFKEKLAAGKKIFRSFNIDGEIKYLNHNATPNANKKMAHWLCEATNSGFNQIVTIDEKSEWSENGREYAAGFRVCGIEDEFWNHNVEAFDRYWVGDHKINYFMHKLFVDGDTYTIKDILYMKPEDWSKQFNIYLSDEEVQNGK